MRFNFLNIHSTNYNLATPLKRQKESKKKRFEHNFTLQISINTPRYTRTTSRHEYVNSEREIYSYDKRTN